jgi:hypothetical protein
MLGLLIIFLFGLAVFHSSFETFRLRRKIKDTPRSKIDSAAIGRYVEIKGKIEVDDHDLIKSPLTGREGASFVWNFYVKGRQIFYFYSHPFLYLSDGGPSLAAVDLGISRYLEEEITFDTKIKFRPWNIPPHVEKVLNDYDMKRFVGWYPLNSYQIREKVFQKGEEVYVIGAANPPPKEEKSLDTSDRVRLGKPKLCPKSRINLAYQEAYNDPMMVAIYDENGNNQLDEDEKEKLYLDIEKKILKQFKHVQGNVYLPRVKIFFTKAMDSGSQELGDVFISLKSDKQIKNTLTIRSILLFLAGAFVLSTGLVVLAEWIENGGKFP